MKLNSIIIKTLFISMFFSNWVQACACCGIDNTWSVYKSPLSDYEDSIILGLNLKNGLFDDAPMYEKDYKIKSVQKKSGEFIFHTDSGDVKFKYNKLVEYHMKDITFITNQKYKSSDNADIYHELIIKGKLLIPDKILKSFQPDRPAYPLRKSMNARMIFQGFGNACIEGSKFKKWLIKLDVDEVNFQGSGLIKPRKQKNK